MPSTQYTPGPWEVRNHFFVLAAHPWRQGAQTVVCEIDRHAWTSGNEAKANAHLIAAAPELLEALEGMFGALANARSAVFERGHQNYRGAEHHEAALERHVERARAAIAKATGQATTEERAA